MPNNDIDIKAGYKQVFIIAYPVMFSMIANSLHHLTDTYFLGMVNSAQQGASGLGGTLTWTTFCLFVGTINVIITFTSQSYGAKKFKECAKPFWIGIWFSIFAGFITAGLILFLPALIKLITPQKEIIRPFYLFTSIKLAGSIFVYFNFAFVNFFNGLGKTKIPMFIGIFTNLLNVFLDWLLIFGNWGFPRLEIAGAAWGTIISIAAGNIILFFIFSAPKMKETFATTNIYFPSIKEIKRFLNIGFPIGIQMCLGMLAWFTFYSMISNMGVAQLAANSIILTICMVSFMPGHGLSIAANTLVGRYIGAGRLDLARQSAYTAIKLAMIIMSLAGLCFLLFRQQLMELFSKDPEVIYYGSKILMIAAAFQIADAIQGTTSGALKGAGDTKYPMYLSIIFAWTIFVPFIYIFGFVFGYGVIGAWFSTFIYFTLLAISYLLRFKNGPWEKIKI
ncbi:MAG: MATE family efflux transporter [Pseudomonadota bacterium]